MFMPLAHVDSARETLARANFGVPELAIILVIVVVVFGATKLPQLGKGVGEAIRNFKRAQREAEREEVDVTPRLEAESRKPVDAQLDPQEEKVRKP